MSKMLTEQHRLQEKPMQMDDGAKEKPSHESDTLDEALKETFPASDPVAIGVTCLVTTRK